MTLSYYYACVPFVGIYEWILVLRGFMGEYYFMGEFIFFFNRTNNIFIRIRNRH